MKNFTRILILFSATILMFISNKMSGQKTGKVDYAQIGISFTIPQGWLGQEREGMFLMGSNTIPGLVILMPQNYGSLEAMKAELKNGYSDQMGTNLMLSGNIENLGNQKIGGTYTGTLEGQQVKAYVIAALNPHGQEVLIMSVTTTQSYSDEQPKVAKSLSNSLQFAKPKTGPIVNEWKQMLSNTRLTYMDSYYSSSYTSGGISGGYSTEMRFDLCAAGYFNHNGSDNMTVGSDVSSGYSSGSSRGSGSWDIITDAAGNPILQLKFNNGKVWEYNLEMRDKKLHMNGKRYYRTWKGDYAPNCP